MPLKNQPVNSSILDQGVFMADGREEREEREKRREQAERENRDDKVDRDQADQWKPERTDS